MTPRPPGPIPRLPPGWRLFKVSPAEQAKFSTTYRAITPEGLGMFWGYWAAQWKTGRSAEQILEMVKDGRMVELTKVLVAEGL